MKDGGRQWEKKRGTKHTTAHRWLVKKKKKEKKKTGDCLICLLSARWTEL
jgi:hypothetical protein